MSVRNRDNEPIHRVSRSDHPRTPLGGDMLFRRISDQRLSAHPQNICVDPEKMTLLPAAAEKLFGDQLEHFGFKGTLETILAGTRDKDSPLSALREHEATIVREIFFYLGNQWAAHVKQTVPAYLVGTSDSGGRMQFNYGRIGHKSWTRRDWDEGAETTSSGFEDGFVSYARVGEVKFPEPVGRNVNMMPFIFGSRSSLPDDLKCYFPLIEKCPYMKDDIGKVGFLTVHESYVDAEKAQRREGLHIESPGCFSDDAESISFTPGVEHRWGMGVFWGPDRYEGGIYMASSVKGTSKVWDALVDSNVPGIVDRHGGCEHLRGLIGEGKTLEAGELIWMTDLTPHEALPQKESGFRQFFRVVTPSVSHWFADHSTQNPKVPLPADVTIVHGNKFENVDLKSNQTLQPIGSTNEQGQLTSVSTVNLKEGEAVKKASPAEKAKKKHRKKMCNQAAAAEKLMAIEPKDFFKLEPEYKGKCSKFDDNGIPTHLADGAELNPRSKKKLQKE